MLFYRLLAAAAALGSIGWACSKPGWDSVCAALAALVVLAATFLPSQKQKGEQVQTIERGGVGIQAGRDAKVGDIHREG